MEKTCTFQILFTSDIHGAFRDYCYAPDKENPTRGLSRIVTLMRRDRDIFDGQTFIVNVGDIIQGNATGPLIKNKKFADTYKPYPLLAAFDALGYDIVSLGNHEFNFGVESLLNAFEGYKGEKLCGNVFSKDSKLLDGFNAYTVKTLDCGLRVAFIGVVSPNIMAWDERNMAGYIVTDAAEETSRIIKTINEQGGADLYIVLGHMHTHNELQRHGSGAIDVARTNPEITLFLGAHFHTRVSDGFGSVVLDHGIKFTENLDSAQSYGRVLITAKHKNGRWYVGKPNDVSGKSGIRTEIIVLAEQTGVDNDPAVLAATEEAHQDLKRYMRETIVGRLEGGPLVPPPEIRGTHEIILRPTPLVHLLGKVMLRFSKADIAAVSINSYDANCPQGDISLGKIAGIYVYDNNSIYRMRLTGRQIRQWMEWSYEFFGGVREDGKPDTQPAVNPDTDLTIPYGASKLRKVYLHDKFEGIHYTVDLTKPAGNRITILGLETGDAEIAPLSEDETYTVATTNYRAATNLLMHTDDGVFRNTSEPVAEVDEGGMDVVSPQGNINMLDWIAEYTQEQGGVIQADTCENWRFDGWVWDEAARQKAVELINGGALPYTHTKAVKKSDIGTV